MLSWRLIICLLIVYVAEILAAICEIFLGWDYAFAVTILFLGPLTVMMVFRPWVRDQAGIGRRLQNFCIKDATCTVDSDRILIVGAIVALMREARAVPSAANT